MKQRKQLILKNKTYTLDFTPHEGMTFECRISVEGDDVRLITKTVSSEHDAKFLAHVTAYKLAGLRQGHESDVDKKCEEECEEGWAS
jgi:hypothetical protein